MFIVLFILSVVALVQAVAWMGAERIGRRRRLQGQILAPVAYVAMLVVLLHVLAPGFWRGQ